MKKLAALLLMAMVAQASAAPSFFGFAGGAFIQGPVSGTVTVPNVVGLSQSAANTALIGAMLVTGAVTPICSAVTANQVLSQAPVSGSMVASGSLVDLVTSTGVACVAPSDRQRMGLSQLSIGIGE